MHEIGHQIFQNDDNYPPLVSMLANLKASTPYFNLNNIKLGSGLSHVVADDPLHPDLDLDPPCIAYLSDKKLNLSGQTITMDPTAARWRWQWTGTNGHQSTYHPENPPVFVGNIYEIYPATPATVDPIYQNQHPVTFPVACRMTRNDTGVYDQNTFVLDPVEYPTFAPYALAKYYKYGVERNVGTPVMQAAQNWCDLTTECMGPGQGKGPPLVNYEAEAFLVSPLWR